MTAALRSGATPNPLADRNARGNKALMSAGTLILLLANLIVLFLVRMYLPMLQAFGMDLPNLTRWLIDWHLCLLLAVFVAPMLWAGWPIPARSGLAALIGGIALGGALVALTAFALYLPIMRLAALAP